MLSSCHYPSSGFSFQLFTFKSNREILCTFHPASPNANILHNCSAVRSQVNDTGVIHRACSHFTLSYLCSYVVLYL
jgi:hypothetical protein